MTALQHGLQYVVRWRQKQREAGHRWVRGALLVLLVALLIAAAMTYVQIGAFPTSNPTGLR